MNTKFIISAMMACTVFLSNCTKEAANPQTAFMESLSALCGKSFAGKLVSADEADKDFASKVMVMNVRECTSDEIRIPFHVDEDRSRTWILTKTDAGLRLKHRHNHEDGHPDDVTMYGGDTDAAGTATRQTFPVDQYSKDMFVKNGLDVSVTNIWAVEITDEIYAYELRRKGRHFRVEFDLTKEIETPPAPW